MVYLYTIKLSRGDAYAELLKFSHAELKLIQSLLKAGASPQPHGHQSGSGPGTFLCVIFQCMGRSSSPHRVSHTGFTLLNK